MIEFELCDFSNPDHLNALAALTNHYIADPMGGAELLDKRKQLRLVDGLANHPTAEVWLAIVGDEVVGLATCFVNFSTFHVKSYLYIHDIIVLNHHRGKGYGEALMQKLIDSSTERDFCKITLEVREDNHVAQTMYRKLGFAACNPDMLFWSKAL